jgi:hypothetical protein
VPEIDSEIVIERPVEEVFDLVVDERHEPRLNPRMIHAELISEGPSCREASRASRARVRRARSPVIAAGVVDTRASGARSCVARLF